MVVALRGFELPTRELDITMDPRTLMVTGLATGLADVDLVRHTQTLVRLLDLVVTGLATGSRQSNPVGAGGFTCFTTGFMDVAPWFNVSFLKQP